MAFCSQCGQELAEGSRFCPGCGTAVRGAEAPATLKAASAVPQASAARSGVQPGMKAAADAAHVGKVVGVLDIVLTVLCFMPWINFNLYLWSGSYSLPGLIEIVGSFQNNASSLLGSAYTSTDFGSILPLVLLAVAAAWAAVEILLVRDAYRSLTGKDNYAMGGSGGAFALSLLVFFVSFVSNQTIAGQLGTSVEVVSTTMWLWVSLIVSLGALIYAGTKDKSEE